MSTIVDSTKVQVIIRRDGSLVLGIEPNGFARRVYEFQRIHIIGSGKAIVDFSWEDSDVSMKINGQTLLSGDSSQIPLLA